MGKTKMKILLTGNKGYIGTRLEQSLSMLGHTIVGLDIKHNEVEDLLFCQFPEDEFDLVIHLAGRSGVRESIKDPAAYWMNNVEGSRRLFERYADTRVLYASSNLGKRFKSGASMSSTRELEPSTYKNGSASGAHNVTVLPPLTCARRLS